MLKKISNTHSSHFTNFIASLVVAQKKKKLFMIYWPCPKIVLLLLQMLREEGFIIGFEVSEFKNASKVKVLLKYYPGSNKPLINRIEAFATPSYQNNISNKKLLKLTSLGSGVLVLSTVQGLRTASYCLSQGEGGNLLCRIT